MAHLVGVDVGSQSVKALVMAPDGTVLATAARPYRMQHPHSGWAEQDPLEWEAGLAAAVKEARESAGIAPGDVAALGLACQVDGVVAADKDLEPLRPAIIWLDRRAGEQTTRLAQAAGGEDALLARTGLVADPSHSGPKAMWLTDHEPEIVGRARWLSPVAGYLVGRLTGEVAQDHANASSTLIYDLRARDWAADLAEQAGLDLAQQPPIRPSHAPAGTLTAGAAEALGLSTDCVVVVGTGDEHAATLGAGGAVAGQIVDVTGTAEPVTVPADDVVVDDGRLVETHAHAVDGMLLVENPGFVSGGSTAWWAATAGFADQGVLFERAAQAPPGSDGALFLPALSGAMAPRWNGDMRGVFAGLGMNHDATHLSRAVLEGCAYALRDIVDRFAALGLASDELLVVGGGARSELWMQIKADVTGRRTRRVLAEEATAQGGAMLAGIASGAFADAQDAVAKVVRLAEDAYEPDPDTHVRYTESHQTYRRLYDGVEGALA